MGEREAGEREAQRRGKVGGRRDYGRLQSPPDAPAQNPSLSWRRAYPGPVRRILPVAAGAAVAAFGALIVGEYEFDGLLPLLAGLVLGLLVSEAVALGGQWRGWVPAAVSALLAAAGILWGGWIDSGEGLEAYPALAWAGAAIAAVVAVVRARPRPTPRRRPST